ncbi:MAG TPA: NAD(P)-dependent oxidoreductase [Xanthobacteraceae bacterium]|nr:NAD(P)-dependent oxidoreductase [Xanthobacteraceae bacterium]
MSETILVTGAGGLIGRAVVQKLVSLRHDVVGITRKPGPGCIVADLAAEDTDLHRLVGKPRAIIHLAAAVPHAAESPDTLASAALTRRIDQKVAAAARKWEAKVIYVSTAGLYDPFDVSLKRENSAIKIRSPYFAAKRDGELLFSQIAPALIFRVSAPYGPGLRRNLILAKMIAKARRGELLEIWGNGTREQDFVASADLGDLIAYGALSNRSGIYNAAAGRPLTMLQLATLIVKALKSGSIAVGTAPDAFDNATARYDITSVSKTFDWKPVHELAGDVRSLDPAEFRND